MERSNPTMKRSLPFAALTALVLTITQSRLAFAQAELRCPSDWLTTVEQPTVASTQFQLNCDSYTTLPEGRFNFRVRSVDSHTNATEFAAFTTQLRALGTPSHVPFSSGAIALQLVDGVRSFRGRHGSDDVGTEHVRIALAQAGNQALFIEGSVFGLGEESMRTRVVQLVSSSVGLAATPTPWVTSATCPAGMEPDSTTLDFVLGAHPVVHCATPDHRLLLQVHESRVLSNTLALAQKEAMISAQLLDIRGWVVPQDWEARKREWARIAQNTQAFSEGSAQGWLSVREGRMEQAGRPRFRQGTVRWLTIPLSNGHHVSVGMLAFDQRRSGRVLENMRQFVRENLRGVVAAPSTTATAANNGR